MRRRKFLVCALAIHAAGCGGDAPVNKSETNTLTTNLFVGNGFYIPLTLQIAANNAAISQSDYCSVAVTSLEIRFTRPTVDGQGFETTNPGARVRFKTSVQAFSVSLNYTNLVTRLDTYNGFGVVLADGVIVQAFNRAQGVAGSIVVGVSLKTEFLRTIEVVMPYCASVDFTGLMLPAGGSISAASAPAAVRYVVGGDSITHGFSASTIDKTWMYILAVNKGWQCINHGYGGRQVDRADGTAMANLTPTVASYLIGYNNFAAQTALATFKTEFTAFVNNFRAINTAAKLYCITPLYTPNSFGALTIEMYRQQIRDALTTLGNSLNILVEGAGLALNDITSFPDNVHPSDVGAAQISISLQSVVIA